jgi:hypothetical protein
LTDANNTIDIVIDLEIYDITECYYKDIVVDIVSDKGLSAVVYPVLNKDLILGEASDTIDIPNGGGAIRAVYANAAVDKVKFTLEKIESGDMSNFICVIKGIK